MRLLGRSNVSFVIWQAASFYNNGHKMSSKTQNERWMGTGRRSILDNHVFRKHSPEYPGKPLKFGRKSPGKPW